MSALAAVLIERGVRPGDKVLVHSKNSNEMFESMFATFRVGRSLGSDELSDHSR